VAGGCAQSIAQTTLSEGADATTRASTNAMDRILTASRLYTVYLPALVSCLAAELGSGWAEISDLISTGALRLKHHGESAAGVRISGHQTPYRHAVSPA
jgi:hypothetical protein